jgi:hypothetical protein
LKRNYTNGFKINLNRVETRKQVMVEEEEGDVDVEEDGDELDLLFKAIRIIECCSRAF